MLSMLTGWLFHFTCHQNPELLVHLNGYTLPFCYRCGGIYLGVALSSPFIGILQKLSWRWLLGLGLILITTVEWFLANSGFTASNMLSRSLTGFVGGMGLVVMLSQYIRRLSLWMVLPLLGGISLWLITGPVQGVEAATTLAFLVFWTVALFQFVRHLSANIKKGIIHEKINASA